MGDAKPYDAEELAELRRDVSGPGSRFGAYRAEEVQRLLATLDAERSARVRAEAELAATRAGGVERETQYLAVVAESHKSFAAARRLERDLDAARGLLRTIQLNIKANDGHMPIALEAELDDFIIAIDAIAPAAEGTPITGAQFVEAIHAAIPDAFSDLDDVLPGDATAPAEAQRWGVFIGDHRCQFGTGTEVEMRAHAAGFNAGRKPSQEQYEARPLSPIPRTGGE